jgi:cytochrome c-type biogenesis protein CcmH/NrfG
MFSVDDRAANVVTTVALFLIVAVIIYLARGTLFVLFLSLLFSYLLEPAVGLAQQHTRLGRKNRTWAIDNSEVPAHSSACQWLGKLYENEKKPELAVDAYRTALTLDPENKAVQQALKRLQNQKK